MITHYSTDNFKDFFGGTVSEIVGSLSMATTTATATATTTPEKMISLVE